MEINELYGEQFYIGRVLSRYYNHGQHLTLLRSAKANGWLTLPKSIELVEYINKRIYK